MSQMLDLLGPGACRRLSTGPTYIKVGGVCVTSTLVKEGILAAKDLRLHPIVLRPKTQKLEPEVTSHTPPLEDAPAETTLKEALFGKSLPFSHAQSAITAFYNSDDRYSIPVEVLFRDFEKVIDTISEKMCPTIRHLFIQQLGVDGEERHQGQSAEFHKEPTDQACVRNLLLFLTGDDRLQLPLVYSEELSFKLSDSSCGPHGSIDLIIGVDRVVKEDVDLSLKLPSTAIIGLSNASLSETKSGETRFASSTPKSNSDRLVKLLEVNSQAVLELLSVAQACQTSGPHILFLANRFFIRPFIYYKKFDVLFTTSADIKWRSCSTVDGQQDTRLVFEPVCLVAMLLNTANAIHFVSGSAVEEMFSLFNFPKTGFVKAMKTSDCDLSKAELVCTSYKPIQKEESRKRTREEDTSHCSPEKAAKVKERLKDLHQKKEEH